MGMLVLTSLKASAWFTGSMHIDDPLHEGFRKLGDKMIRIIVLKLREPHKPGDVMTAN